MTTYAELDTAFRGLLAVLTNEVSPYFSAIVSSAWLGSLGQASALARDQGWNGLAGNMGQAQGLDATFDQAAKALESSIANGDSAVLAALQRANQALHVLHGLFYP